MYNQLFGILEIGFFEKIQFLSYLISAFIGFRTYQILKQSPSHNPQRLLILLFIFGCSFIGLEEISYGQHIFKWITPEYISSINLQNETNIHNLTIIQKNAYQAKAFIFIAWIGSLSYLFRFNINPLSTKDLVLADWFAASYFLPLALFYTQLIYIWGYGNDHQETFETVFSFGFLVIAISNFKKVRYFLTKPTQ